ncbi:MAG: transglutaminase family protein [Pseudomonadota bacterium]
MSLCHIDATLEYALAGPTHLLFNIEAAHVDGQRIVNEQLHVHPPLDIHRFSDGANGNRFMRLNAEAGTFKLHYQAQVELVRPDSTEGLEEVPIQALPDEVLHYLMPTRYCESDLMGQQAQALFGNLTPGIGRVRAVTQWLQDNIAYEVGTTNGTTSASDVYAQRTGVCRDFAHLGITFCRALNIPARLVVGYVLFDEPPQDFHAVFEAWLGGRWVLFDGTGLAPVDKLVRIGTGRDAKDVAFATMFGPQVQMTHMELTIDGEGGGAPIVGGAVPPPAPQATAVA